MEFQLPDLAPIQQLPRSAEALHTLRQADRAQAAEVVDQRLQVEVEKRVEAELARRIATEVADQVARKVQQILESWRLAQQRRFGASSEAHPGQGQLFNEAEAIEPEDDTQADVAPTASPARPARRRGKRKPLPPELPRVTRVVDVPPDAQACACGMPRVKIGEDVREQLDIVPMQIRVIRTIRPRYGCPKGEHAPVVAPAVPVVLPHSQFGAGFLATLLTVKYVDGVPLNRFAKVLSRHEVEIPRQSLARAVIATRRALQPLHNLLRDTLLDAEVLHMDETPVQVCKEAAKAPTAKSYMWVQRGGPPGRSVILFDYDPSRSSEVPKRLLEGWQGYLMTDDYAGYAAVARRDGIEPLACMAHARRKFVEAKRVAPKGRATRADQALAFFARLYRIESQIKDHTHEARFHARQTRSLPVLADFKVWLDKTILVITPKSRLGRALAYLQRVWPRLIRYTERGDLPIDNNPCENAIRPFVIGRKNWLFSDTPGGAHASAVIYSLIETAKANGQEPHAWLRYVLERLPMAESFDDMEALLPWNLHAQDLAMNLAAA